MNFSLYYPPFHVDKDKTNTSGPRWMEWINGFDLMLNNCSVPEVSADLGAIMLNAVMRRCLVLTEFSICLSLHVRNLHRRRNFRF